jgi:hypothetical protein
VDTDVSKKHAASIFRVYVCRFRKMLGYIGRLQRVGHGRQGDGVKKETQSMQMGIIGQDNCPV